MKRPRVTPAEQAERDRLWRETLHRQIRQPIPLALSSQGERQRQADERYAELDAMAKGFRCAEPGPTQKHGSIGGEPTLDFAAIASGSATGSPAPHPESGLCEGDLRIAFREGKYILVCSVGHVEPPVERIPPLYERWLKGELGVPSFIANQYEKRLRKEIAKMTTVPSRRDEIEALARRPIISEQEAMTLLNVIWPEAPMSAKQRAAIICRQYRLNPMMRHVALLRFESKKTGKVSWEPVLEIKASRIIAQREGRYSYIDGPRMMTDHEQDSINGQIDETRWWSITVIKDSEGNLYRGYGSWPKNEPAYGTDKGNTQQNMAHIRSERQALAKFAPGKLPEDIEVVEGSAVELREVRNDQAALAQDVAAEKRALAQETRPAQEDQEEQAEEQSPIRQEWNDLVAKAAAMNLQGVAIPTMALDATDDFVRNATLWLKRKMDEDEKKAKAKA